MQEIVYRVPGKNHGPSGKTYDWMPVRCKDELEARLKEGWYNTLAEAIDGKPNEAKEVRARNDDGTYIGDDPSTPDINEAYVAPPTRNELEVKAKELGIEHRANISDKKLRKLIDHKLKG